MNFVPKMNRRSFLVTSAAAGGGLALGMNLPMGPDVVRAADGSPEVNAWVVIKPDDTVVIRVVRTEMGQGTLTGLAQLVAEELDCDWSKVTTEYPTPGQSVARKRVWGDFSTGGSARHPHVARICAQGRRGRAHHADPGGGQRVEGAGVRVTAVKGVITHKASNRTTTYGKVAEAAAKLEAAEGRDAQGSEGLEDHRQVAAAARHARQGHRQAGLRADIKLPSMLNAAIKDCPVLAARSRASTPPRSPECRA